MSDRERMLRDAIEGLALQYTGQDPDEMLADGYSDDEGERKLVETLVRVTERFLMKGYDPKTERDTDLYSCGLSAAEAAIRALEVCGLAQSVCGSLAANWTNQRRRLLRKLS